ncbi:proline--tRNA ligase [Ureibacillus terrenus]|uniref:Proline--tRNA ligase n=1 Tax=Ureibacillus terrenus TaxID=118246 RepID=A0A540V661_9BACL|nr:proline--tRNA ligase [Ureibacillus terrenus]TQE91653.1 proline--tRNA ligase [Ureibacillus terrenus]
MKQSRTLIPTMREVPRNAETKSCQMLMRAGYIRKHPNGTYSYLPLAKRVMQKIIQIVREEIEKRDAIEVVLPYIHTDLPRQSGSAESLKGHPGSAQDDRKDMLFASNLQLMTSIISDEIKTYKKLPLLLYQFQNRFRSDIKPSLDLLQAREFLVKEAYLFHNSKEGLNDGFEQMKEAYERIFSRLGLTVDLAEADTKIAGEESYEFVIRTEIGQEWIAYSDQSDYAVIAEIAKVSRKYEPFDEDLKPLEKIATPSIQTINDLCGFLEVDPSKCIKSLVLNVDGKIVVALVRGDHQLNLRKIAKILNATNVRFASDEEIVENIGCPKGFIGPIKLPIDIMVIADHGIKSIVNGASGANEEGYHYINVNPNRDFAINLYEDIRYIEEGDPSPDGHGTIQLEKGISIGRLTKINPAYAEKMGATITGQDGKPIPLQIASFQLDLTRIFAVLAERFQDEKGLSWPKHLAPYDLHVMAANAEDEEQHHLAELLYNILTTYRYDVLFDDRDERAGVKFADADLIGLPIRVTAGKKAKDGIVELKNRKTGETVECVKEELIDRLNEFYRTE